VPTAALMSFRHHFWPQGAAAQAPDRPDNRPSSGANKNIPPVATITRGCHHASPPRNLRFPRNQAANTHLSRGICSAPAQRQRAATISPDYDPIAPRTRKF
jgi:hypothetical protein